MCLISPSLWREKEKEWIPFSVDDVVIGRKTMNFDQKLWLLKGKALRVKMDIHCSLFELGD
jgi:hypothetical protein